MPSKVIIHYKGRRFVAAAQNCLFLVLGLLGVARVHDEPQVGHKPLEEHPEADKDCVHVETERFKFLDRLQSASVSGVFKVHGYNTRTTRYK